jgi:hypothetical protein
MPNLHHMNLAIKSRCLKTSHYAEERSKATRLTGHEADFHKADFHEAEPHVNA